MLFSNMSREQAYSNRGLRGEGRKEKETRDIYNNKKTKKKKKIRQEKKTKRKKKKVNRKIKKGRGGGRG